MDLVPDLKSYMGMGGAWKPWWEILIPLVSVRLMWKKRQTITPCVTVVLGSRGTCIRCVVPECAGEGGPQVLGSVLGT